MTLFLLFAILIIKPGQSFWFTSDDDHTDKPIDAPINNIDKDLVSKTIINIDKDLNNDNNLVTHCVEDPIEEREQKCIVIVSAKVLNKEPDPKNNELEIAHIQIKRVFKGGDVIDAIDDERANVISKGRFNKVIPIHGIGERSICESSVDKGDTRIFMLDLEYFGNLRISSSVIPISSYNLDRTDAAVTGKSLLFLLFARPVESPWKGVGSQYPIFLLLF